jgi:hypothetical protein
MGGHWRYKSSSVRAPSLSIKTNKQTTRGEKMKKQTAKLELKTCVVPITWLPMAATGWGNGYVAVPREHKYFSIGYDDVPVKVHGGLTFGHQLSDIKKDFFPEIKGKARKDWWVFGFDTAHFSDTKLNWTESKVKEETENLKKQLEDMK